LFECIAARLKRPWALAAACMALLRGRAAFKAALARRARVDVSRDRVSLVLGAATLAVACAARFA
jgi:hypothetical protein